MKVFGIGLSKTATCSLNKALNILGIKSIHGPCDEITQTEIIKGKINISLLDKYDGITDIPMALFYIDLDIFFPNSKFILTIRNLDDWIESIRKHYKVRKITKWNYFIRASAYGCISFNEQRMRIAYQMHIDSIMNYFHNKDNLLIMDICKGEGWKQLCTFLNKPLPKKKFPWENKNSIKKIY